MKTIKIFRRDNKVVDERFLTIEKVDVVFIRIGAYGHTFDVSAAQLTAALAAETPGGPSGPA
jgi:hypothetical protein